MIIQWKSSFLPFFPVDIFRTDPMFFHSDTILHRTDEFAQIAAYAFLFDDVVMVVRMTGSK